jgi:hypothetical protein
MVLELNAGLFCEVEGRRWEGHGKKPNYVNGRKSAEIPRKSRVSRRKSAQGEIARKAVVQSGPYETTCSQTRWTFHQKRPSICPFLGRFAFGQGNP